MTEFLLSDFDTLACRRSSVDFYLADQRGEDATGAGATISVARGTPLWMGTFTVARGRDVRSQRRLEAMLFALQAPGASIRISPPFHTPAADPDMSALGAATPTVSVSSSGVVTVAGLPAGYTLSQGDFIGWRYGTPFRQGLHMVTADVSADGSGNATVAVVPPAVPAGSNPLRLDQPYIKAVTLPGSFQGFTYDGRSQASASFGFRQVLP